ncbi:MAG: class I SAM-dependent methyltransferase [Candidatus Aenigmarchaeota archaeon]|nr:class I SAM-dependent methyltransferase [Candidatus Aenigmarchaeota archaeon]MCK5334248.1 class I SAM-dependent methyltransferase [Candidatus Aenigmarchaeota archaeon]
MTNFTTWQYDELKQAGIDYENIQNVKNYDSKVEAFRDLKKENIEIMRAIDISKNQKILEFGCGTGSFALEVAMHCNMVFAVDVSKAMLDAVKKKAVLNEIKNITFHHAGFLTYKHNADPLNAIVSQFALHHLPDFWKLVALKSIHSMLKDDGIFYLKDTVYSFDINQYKDFFGALVEKAKNSGNEAFSKDVESSISEEFSTLDWIMKSLLNKAGFFIEKATYQEGILAQYVCKKQRIE